MNTKRARSCTLVQGVAAAVALGLLVLVAGCSAEATPSRVSISLDSTAGGVGPASGLQLLILLTVLSVAPALLVMVTSFTRIVIVLAFIRSAVGIPQLPPNQVLLGLGLFLTFFVMAPTWNAVQQQALEPYLAGRLSQEQALEAGVKPLRDFMFKQVREKDLALFIYLARLDPPRSPDEVPTYVLVPAFVISELRTAFQMGFTILIPFLVIDLVVSSALMSVGMMMLPPVMVSLPFKVLVFVLVDGWHLLIGSLVASFQT